jgi:carboxymethylenebutenolidase
MPSQTITVTAADGRPFSAYLSVPAAGRGPGLILLQEIYGVNATIRAATDLFAEEGYVVLAPDLFFRLQPNVGLGYSPADRQTALGYLRRFDVNQGVADIGAALHALKARPECTGKAGVIGFCLGGKMAFLSAARLPVEVAVAFYGGGIDQHLGEAGNIRCPLVMHFGARDEHIPLTAVRQIKDAFAGRSDVEAYTYPDVGHAFYLPGRDGYSKLAAQMAHSPTIGVLRRTMGPHYDLNSLWEKHCEYEFATRNADDTMKTMVAEPYVNHIPTMTGGVGHDELRRFYANHFIPKLPKDTKLVPISRTVGADRLVDELLFCFTHDKEIDFLLPGVPPTGKYVEIPLVAIVCFRGDKLYHEHIYWDQATALVQLGLLDPQNLPVAGVECAKKVVDEKVPSNTLMKRWAESEGK